MILIFTLDSLLFRLQGKFDSRLRWPVVGKITISILSQRRVGRETVRCSFKTDVTSLEYHR